MTHKDNSTEQKKTGFEAASDERQSMFPNDGYALVEIDMLKPPGKALTKLAEYESLEEVSMTPATDLTDYVVYDSEGHAYSHDDL